MVTNNHNPLALISLYSVVFIHQETHGQLYLKSWLLIKSMEGSSELKLGMRMFSLPSRELCSAEGESGKISQQYISSNAGCSTGDLVVTKLFIVTVPNPYLGTVQEAEKRRLVACSCIMIVCISRSLFVRGGNCLNLFSNWSLSKLQISNNYGSLSCCKQK